MLLSFLSIIRFKTTIYVPSLCSMTYLMGNNAVTLTFYRGVMILPILFLLMKKNGINFSCTKDEIIKIGDTEYPTLLSETEEAPRFLYLRGDFSLLHDTRTIALVGSRNASDKGKENTRRVAATLGHNGIIVVSGLAKGIDATAHICYAVSVKRRDPIWKFYLLYLLLLHFLISFMSLGPLWAVSISSFWS